MGQRVVPPYVELVMKELAVRMETRRKGKRRFVTQEDATVAIQRAFRARKLRNLEKAAKMAMMSHGANVSRQTSAAARSRAAGDRGALAIQVPTP
jgi:hypothetical protein